MKPIYHNNLIRPKPTRNNKKNIIVNFPKCFSINFLDKGPKYHNNNANIKKRPPLEIIEAKNGNPGTGEPSKKKRPRTNNNTPNPKNAKIKPIILAICNGIILKPVIIFNPCCTNFPNV